MKTCLLTGCSTGIGRATAIHLARNGYRVIATMRDISKGTELEQLALQENLSLTVKKLDVASKTSIDTCIAEITDEEGQVDVLVNNAGVSNSSPIEIYPEDEHRNLFEINYWGPVRLVQCLLPGMRERADGAIINISSLAGRFVMGIQGAYAASKFALEAFSETLALEVAGMGIRVAIVEPGFIASAIAENTPIHYDKQSPYKHVMRRNGRFFQRGYSEPSSPEVVAEAVLEAMTTDKPRLRYPVGAGHEMIERRGKLSDEQMIAIAASADDEYYSKLKEKLGMDLE